MLGIPSKRFSDARNRRSAIQSSELKCRKSLPSMAELFSLRLIPRRLARQPPTPRTKDERLRILSKFFQLRTVSCRAK